MTLNPKSQCFRYVFSADAPLPAITAQRMNWGLGFIDLGFKVQG